MDAVIISDVHLGSDVCESSGLIAFLESILYENVKTKSLIINGDFFDNMDFRRLKGDHWRVLSLVRKISKRIAVIMVVGNHDDNIDVLSHLLGMEYYAEYVLESGGKRILIAHGDEFDSFIEKRPLITKMADNIYRLLQRIDTSHTLARYAKKRSKIFLRNAERIEREALRRMKQRNCDMVCCGHVHFATENVKSGYYNSGCWTEKPCSYIVIQDGIVKTCSY